MPHHDVESWWNDPEYESAALLSAISTSLGDVGVSWSRIATATGQTTHLGASGPEPTCLAGVDPGRTLSASAQFDDGDTGLLVAIAEKGAPVFGPSDQRLADDAARRLAGRVEPPPDDDGGTMTVGMFDHLLGVRTQPRWTLSEALLGVIAPLVVLFALSWSHAPGSYRPAGLLLFGCVLTAAFASARSAVLCAVVSTVTLWWRFTPPVESWRISTAAGIIDVAVFFGAVVGVVALVIRLGEYRSREHIERQLAEALLDQSSAAVAVFDRDLRCRRANSLMAEMDGHTIAGHLGRTPSELGAVWGQLYEHLLVRVRDDGRALVDHPLHIRVPHLGLERHWTVSLRPVLDHDAAVVGIGASFVDITAPIVSARHAEQLLHLAETLATSVDRREVAECTCDFLGVALSGRGAVALRERDGFVVAAGRGHSRESSECRIGDVILLDSHSPIADAARTRRAVVMQSRAELLAVYPEHRTTDDMVSVAMPLLDSSPGAAAGVMELGWATPRKIGPSMMTLLGTVSSLVAMALARVAATDAVHRNEFRHALDAMLDDVLIASAVRDQSGDIVDFVVDFANGPTSSSLVGLHLSQVMSDDYPLWRDSTIERFGWVVDTGVPFQSGREYGWGTTRGGSPYVSHWNMQVARFGDGVIATTRDVADLVAAEQEAIAATARLEAERTAVRLMQAAALPAVLPAITGLEFAASYRPADRRQPVGGDWYDAFVLADGRVALVIADVSGHGAPAAVFMVQVRNVFRALGDEHADPGHVLARADQVTSALGTSESPFVTCCYAVLDVAGRTLSWAQAGHFSPLLVRRGGTATYLPERPGPPLALGLSKAYPTSSIALEPGDRVVLFTDGLVERRREHLDVGLERLGLFAAERADLPIVSFVDALARSAVERFDDLAVLCVGLTIDEGS